ncbi:expressed protein [Echinococcus multilocularis]|uniref:Expressed protein n=1 Tax=Echinococcus multilocularis TaxID=6211 RepID=A0A068YDT1_ECHMU|nr:expressed protein [Echinococcus multilocularis]
MFSFLFLPKNAYIEDLQQNHVQFYDHIFPKSASTFSWVEFHPSLSLFLFLTVPLPQFLLVLLCLPSLKLRITADACWLALLSALRID